MTTYKYSREDLAEAVRNSISMRQVMQKLNIRLAGGSQSHLTNRIKKEGLNTDHFLGQASLRGTISSKRKTASQILVILPIGSPRPKGGMLKRALLDSGIPYQCAICQLNSWMDQPISLDVDHLNGDWLDNRLTNLRFLCPNCHSQTPTFGVKNRTSDRT